MSKFENRTTIANAVIIDFENLANTKEVTVTIPYTRTLTNAAKLVAKELDIEPNRVSVKSLEQTEFKAHELTSGELINISTRYGLTEMPTDTENGYSAIPYTAYEYYGTAFGYTIEENNPCAFAIVVERLEKRSKNDARGMLAELAASHYGMNVFAIDFKQRHEVKRYAVVNSEEYQKLRYNK